MKKILINIYNCFRNQQKLNGWNKQVKSIRGCIECRDIEKLEPEGKYLLLLPHADDEWIGASSVISSSEYELVLCNMNMPGGDDVKLHRIREIELNNLARTYERKIHKYENNLKDIISYEKPDHIMVPFFVDWHQEHLEVINTLYEYIINHVNLGFDIIMYQVSVPIGERYINRVNGLSRTQYKEKWNTFKQIYQSQKKIPYNRFACNDKISGGLCDSYAAEVFVKLNLPDWVQLHNKLIIKRNQHSDLKNHINDLQAIRNIINDLT